MLPRLAVTPFDSLPKKRWDKSSEKKPRIPVDDLLYSSSDDSDDDDSESFSDITSILSSNIKSESSVTESNIKNIKAIASESERSRVKSASSSSSYIEINDYSSYRSLRTEDFLPYINEVKKKPNPRSEGDARVSEFLLRQLRRSEGYQSFQAWRARKAEERRHHLLRHFEEQVLRFDQERLDEIERQIDENKR